MAQDAQLLAVFGKRHGVPFPGQAFRTLHHKVINILFEVGKLQQARRDVGQDITTYEACLVKLHTELLGEISVEIPAHCDVRK